MTSTAKGMAFVIVATLANTITKTAEWARKVKNFDNSAGCPLLRGFGTEVEKMGVAKKVDCGRLATAPASMVNAADFASCHDCNLRSNFANSADISAALHREI